MMVAVLVLALYAIVAETRVLPSRICNVLLLNDTGLIASLNVTVADGVVDLWGTITSDQERRAIAVLAENTPGVKAVHNHLVFIEPYSGTVIEAPQGC